MFPAHCQTVVYYLHQHDLLCTYNFFQMSVFSSYLGAQAFVSLVFQTGFYRLICSPTC